MGVWLPSPGESGYSARYTGGAPVEHSHIKVYNGRGAGRWCIIETIGVDTIPCDVSWMDGLSYHLNGDRALVIL